MREYLFIACCYAVAKCHKCDKVHVSVAYRYYATYNIIPPLHKTQIENSTDFF